MSQQFSVINGEFVEKEAASIKINDLSVSRGYGIFDFFKTINGKPVFIDDHIDRFFYSASEMRLKPDIKKIELKKLVLALHAKNAMATSGIKVLLTGGYSADGYSIGKPNLIITQDAIKFDPTVFETGTRLITNEHQRQLPQVKSIDYLYGIYMKSLIKERGADDVLYHFNGEITECPRANFYIVTRDNAVVTPAKNVLQGITRKKILGFSQLVKITEGLITLSDLANAKEAFITSTTKNVLPVLEINGKPVGNGKPGEITRKISDRLSSLVARS